ncbi:MAG TPA: AMP-binding protein [Anaerolineales bacterium]|nr:AMP-binding protein [Anaerolineales bacterium]
METSLDWLANRAYLTPDRIALIESDREWTCRELNLSVAEIACHLADAGIAKGEPVALFMQNLPESVLSLFAIQRIGAVPVLLSNRLTISEIQERLAQTSCKLMVRPAGPSSDSFVETVGQARQITIEVSHFTPDGSTKPGSEVDRYLSRAVRLDELCVTVFTSGSAGSPLGVHLTYSNCLWSALGSAIRLGNHPDDLWLACLPLHHIGGLSILFRGLITGTPVILQSGFEPEAVARAIFDQGANLVSLVPTMLHRLVTQVPESIQSAPVRFILVGGGKTPAHLIHEALDLDLKIALTYGLTETASQVSTATPRQIRGKPGSVGRPLFFNRVSIRAESGEILPPGETGEIVIAGPTVMQGYARSNSGRGRRLEDSDLHTGDLGYFDPDGDLWVTGRLDEMINSGGEKIHPEEVVAALRQHPGVREAQAVGIEDPEWGERVAAAIVPEVEGRLAPEDLIEFLRPRIASHKIPKKILFMRDLPLTGSGKVDMAQIRRKLEASDGS